MEMGILKESNAIVIRQLSWLYYCGNDQRNSWIGISGGPQPSRAQKRIFFWINTEDFCSSLWICTAETLNKQYEHGGWSDLVQGGMEVFVSPVSSGLVKEDSASTFNIITVKM